MTSPGARPPDRQATGLTQAAAGYVAGVVLSVIAVTAVAGGGKVSASSLSTGALAADLAGLWIGLVGAAVLVSRTRRSGSLARDFGFRIGAWWDLPLGAAIGLACQYLLIPAVYLPFEQLDHSLAHQLGRPAQADTSSVHTVATLLVTLALLAVAAPLVEELFFRGLLLKGLLLRTGPVAAVVISALLFSLAHFEAVQFPGLALFGAVLGVLAWRTGRLAPGVAAHAAFNASAVLSIAHLH